jgi:hypothetical protein
MTIIDGADVLYQGAHHVIKYRRRIDRHLKAIDGDGEGADEVERGQG